MSRLSDLFKPKKEPVPASDKLEKRIESVVREVMTRAIEDTESFLSKLKSTFDIGAQILKLKEELEVLKIEKGRKEEEFAKREREIEHKVGLERKRQEFEIKQAKREALVGVREENLKADQERFSEQLKFHEDRFSKEVGYLKEMLGEMLKRLPSAEISIEEKRTVRK